MILCTKCDHTVRYLIGDACENCTYHLSKNVPGKPISRDELIIELLRVAACPNCDGSGAKYDSYGGIEQCQWCYERHEVLK